MPPLRISIPSPRHPAGEGFNRLEHALGHIGGANREVMMLFRGISQAAHEAGGDSAKFASMLTATFVGTGAIIGLAAIVKGIEAIGEEGKEAFKEANVGVSTWVENMRAGLGVIDLTNQKLQTLSEVTGKAAEMRERFKNRREENSPLTGEESPDELDKRADKKDSVRFSERGKADEDRIKALEKQRDDVLTGAGMGLTGKGRNVAQEAANQIPDDWLNKNKSSVLKDAGIDDHDQFKENKALYRAFINDQINKAQHDLANIPVDENKSISDREKTLPQRRSDFLFDKEQRKIDDEKASGKDTTLEQRTIDAAKKQESQNILLGQAPGKFQPGSQGFHSIESEQSGLLKTENDEKKAMEEGAKFRQSIEDGYMKGIATKKLNIADSIAHFLMQDQDNPIGKDLRSNDPRTREGAFNKVEGMENTLEHEQSIANQNRNRLAGELDRSLTNPQFAGADAKGSAGAYKTQIQAQMQGDTNYNNEQRAQIESLKSVDKNTAATAAAIERLAQKQIAVVSLD